MLVREFLERLNKLRFPKLEVGNFVIYPSSVAIYRQEYKSQGKFYISYLFCSSDSKTQNPASREFTLEGIKRNSSLIKIWKIPHYLRNRLIVTLDKQGIPLRFHDNTKGHNLVGYITFKITNSRNGHTAISDRYYPRYRLTLVDSIANGRAEGLGSILEIIALSDLTSNFQIQYIHTSNFPSQDRKKQLEKIGLIHAKKYKVETWIKSHIKAFKKYIKVDGQVKDF
jgi:hypothetical protein